VTAAFPIILDRLDLFRFPVFEFEIVRDDSRSLPELFVEDGANLVVREREQVDRDQVGRAVVLLRDVAVDNLGGFLQTKTLDFVHALVIQVLVQLDAD